MANVDVASLTIQDIESMSVPDILSITREEWAPHVDDRGNFDTVLKRAQLKVGEAAREGLYRKLGNAGFGTYAKLLTKYKMAILLYNTMEEAMGYMSPETGVISLNRDLDEDQAMVVVRHEILHFYLEHATRLYEHVAAKLLDMTPEEFKEKTKTKSIKELSGVMEDVFDAMVKSEMYGDPTFNIAGDYEISNLSYSDEDKEIVRAMHALVTEDDHADWVDLSMEEMYDRLRDEQSKNWPYGPDEVPGVFIDSKTFVGFDGIYGED